VVPFFLDTNVLVYSFSSDDPRKRGIARALTETEGAIVSSQVLSELARVLTRRLGFAPAEARSIIMDIAGKCEVVTVTPLIVSSALQIMEQYRFAFYDCQIVGAALAAGAETLYSEDMHDGQVVDGLLTIRSPFRLRAEQERRRYRAASRRAAAGA
jgi:predicted nucleic acid-binding protein